MGKKGAEKLFLGCNKVTTTLKRRIIMKKHYGESKATDCAASYFAMWVFLIISLSSDTWKYTVKI